MRQRDARPAAAAGKVRIIGGQWRGSRLEVPAAAGLRPSSDRVRETLFNWLQGHVGGARCLDLFAGSGALGLEAASRGAAHVLMIEKDAAAVAGLRASVHKLDARQVEVVAGDALACLAGPVRHVFDIVFVDPPFDAGLWQPVLDLLLPWLAPDALVYVESGYELPAPYLAGFVPRREGATREVRYQLLQRAAGALRGDPPATLGTFTGGEPAVNP